MSWREVLPATSLPSASQTLPTVPAPAGQPRGTCPHAWRDFSDQTLSLSSQRPTAGGQGVELLALPLVVSVLNLGASYLFRGLATLERHESPVLEVYMAICRCVAARACVWAAG